MAKKKPVNISEAEHKLLKALRRRARRKAEAEAVKPKFKKQSISEVEGDINDLADALGVDAEDIAEAVGIDLEDDYWEQFDPNEDPYVFDDLAEILDLDVSDIWDMYYGYEPGSHGR